MALALPLALILAPALALTWHRALPFDLVMSFLKFSLEEYFAVLNCFLNPKYRPIQNRSVYPHKFVGKSYTGYDALGHSKVTPYVIASVKNRENNVLKPRLFNFCVNSLVM
jgi:hypothetical protein